MTSRAKRDAEIAMAGEFEALADLIRSAETEARRGTSKTRFESDAALDTLWKGYARDISNINSQVAGTNMGTAGMRFQGLGDLASEKMGASGMIQATKQSNLMEIAQTLSDTIATAKQKRMGLARQQSQIELSLADKYRQEEEDQALQREANRLRELEITGGGKDSVANMSPEERNAFLANEISNFKKTGNSFDPSTGDPIYDPDAAIEDLSLKYGSQYVRNPQVFKAVYGANWFEKFQAMENAGSLPSTPNWEGAQLGMLPAQAYGTPGVQDRSLLSAGASGIWNFLTSAMAIGSPTLTQSAMGLKELGTTKVGEKPDNMFSLWEQLLREIWAR